MGITVEGNWLFQLELLCLKFLSSCPLSMSLRIIFDHNLYDTKSVYFSLLKYWKAWVQIGCPVKYI